MLFSSNFFGFTLDFPQNLELARMSAYSVSARNTKASLVMIQRSRGLRLAETGLEAATELLRLISMRRRVRRRPSRPGTTSGLIRKLIQLTTTIRVHGVKYVARYIFGFRFRDILNPDTGTGDWFKLQKWFIGAVL